MPATYFKHLVLGEEFFDPVSGEYWIKTSEDTAQLLSGGDDLENTDFFALGEIVEVDHQDYPYAAADALEEDYWIDAEDPTYHDELERDYDEPYHPEQVDEDYR